jgi:hypothetical protein
MISADETGSFARCRSTSNDKGKPGVSRGRKATGLDAVFHPVSRVADAAQASMTHASSPPLLLGLPAVRR